MDIFVMNAKLILLQEKDIDVFNVINMTCAKNVIRNNVKNLGRL